jgi:hypothetical protein
MAKFNFRRFKYVAFYAGALLVIAAYIFWLGNVLEFWQWTSQNRTVIGRIWSALTSPEGVVAWTGLIAGFVLATILVEKRADAARDLKWKRRKLKLDHKTARLQKPRRTLSKEQKTVLGALQKRGGKLSETCLGGGGMNTNEDIGKWEVETAQALGTILDEEHAGLFLHEPIVPIQLSGYPPNVMHLAGRVQARMNVLNQIIKEFSG